MGAVKFFTPFQIQYLFYETLKMFHRPIKKQKVSCFAKLHNLVLKIILEVTLIKLYFFDDF